MSSPFLIFSFVIWILGGVLGGIYDTLNLDSASFNVIIQFDIFREVTIDLPGFAPLRFPSPNFDYFKAIADVLTWDSAMWQGWASYLRITFLLAISFGFILPLLMSFFSARVGR